MEEKIQEFEAVLLRLKYHPHYVTDVICCIRKMYMFGEPTKQFVEDYANGLTRARGNAYRRAVSIFKGWCITGKEPKRRKHSEIDIDAFDYDIDAFDYDIDAFDYDIDAFDYDIDAFDYDMDAFDYDMDAFDYDMDKKESKEKAYIYRDSHSLMYGGRQ